VFVFVVVVVKNVPVFVFLKRSRDDSCLFSGICDCGPFFVCFLVLRSVLCDLVCVLFGVNT
jgi:hypothetical protein